MPNLRRFRQSPKQRKGAAQMACDGETLQGVGYYKSQTGNPILSFLKTYGVFSVISFLRKIRHEHYIFSVVFFPVKLQMKE